MLLSIHSRTIPLTAPLRAQVERKIHFALDRVLDRIRTIRVRMDDINGPRGGVDKRVTIHVRGERGFVLHTEHTAQDTLAALAVAADRLERLITRDVERRRDLALSERRIAS